MFIKLKNIFLDILFPPLCAGCQKYLKERTEFICNDCLSSIKLNNTLFCPVCQARLPENKRICRHDKDKSRKFPYLLGAATNYNDKIIQNLIHYYKYKSFGRLSSVFSDIIIKYLNSITNDCLINNNRENLNIGNFLIIPIPLHFIREKKRGFNQAKLIAEKISKNLKLEFSESLIRIKNNPPQAKIIKNNPFQTTLNKNMEGSNDRWENIYNAFKLTDVGKIDGKNIILVDDVYTSGATMSEAARLLKSAGAKEIIALVIAKA